MNEKNESAGSPPEAKFKVGAISATVWRNTLTGRDGKTGDVLSVTFARNYLDKDTNQWKTTSSMRANDLPKAVLVLNKAYEYVLLNSQSNLAAEI